MLRPDQVRPFLGHPDPILRDHAISYFRDTADFGSLTADDYWEQLDGKLLSPAEKRSFGFNLTQAPQTDASVARLIRALKHPESPDMMWHHQSTARTLELPKLITHREAVLTCKGLFPETRKHLELRLSMLDLSPELAWERLVELGISYAGRYAGKFDQSESTALIEAAARGGAAVCDLAIKAMQDQSDEMGWAGIFAVQVLGAARYEPAVDALVENYLVDADLFRDETNRALPRIGTVRVIDQIVSLYPGKPWHVRLYADDPLEHIKRPESEAGLVKLLAYELEPKPDGPSASDDRDDEGEPLVEHLLFGLTNLCSLAALDTARGYIHESTFGGDNTHLAKALIASAAMQGVTLPEEKQWRDRIAEKEIETKKRAALFDGMIDGAGQIRTGEKADRDSKDDPAKYARDGSYGSAAPIMPIRNATPKVGRNDPCPCGSTRRF